ncbi:zf-TFIIB domain-containing protein, partial [Candidatus Riflebacteria bacterium]
MLKCPRCQTGLKNTVYEGIQIETCTSCEGEWLDFGELKKVIDTVEDTFTPEEMEMVESIDDNNFDVVDQSPDDLNCVNCRNQKLDRVQYASSTKVFIDKCPFCKGVWLDKGELESIQILVEEWDNKLEGDLNKYGKLARRIKDTHRVSVGKSANIFNSSLA